MEHYGDIISKIMIDAFTKTPESGRLSEFFEPFEEASKKTCEVMRVGFDKWQDVLFPQGLSAEEAAFRIYAVRRLADEFEAALKEGGGPAADTAESFTRLIKSDGRHIKIGFSITPTTHAVDLETGEIVEGEAGREEGDDE